MQKFQNNRREFYNCIGVIWVIGVRLHISILAKTYWDEMSAFRDRYMIIL